MYETFFGLKQPPFSITPDPRYLFMSERHREALAHLLFGLRGTGGIVLLSGEIGAGKTTLCRLFIEQLPASCRAAYIFNPKLTVTELLQSVCGEFGIAVQPLDPVRPTVKDFIDPLNLFLLDCHVRGEQCVLVIDEAQNLSADVLEQLRLLTNLETADRKLLQITLIGQPELRDLVDRPELEQLAQRVVARFHLGPLTADETARYVAHRLALAGRQGVLPFDRGALARLHRHSGGVPRRINLLADRALLGAYANRRNIVGAGMVDQAAREVFGRDRRAWAWPAAWPAALPMPLALALALGAGAALGVGGLWWAGQRPAGGAVAGPAAAAPTAAGPAAASPAGPDLPPGAATAVGPAAPLAPTGSAGLPAAAGPGAAPLDPPSPVTGAGPAPAAAAVAAAALPPPGDGPGQEATTPAATTTAATTAADDGLRFDPERDWSALYSDRQVAWRALAQHWAVRLPGAGDACTQLQALQVGCWRVGRGNLVQLRRLDRPAVLRLADGEGRGGRALLLALNAQTARLAVGTRQWRLPVAQLQRLWTGEYGTLWRMPAGVHQATVQPGQDEAADQALGQALAAWPRTEPLPDAAVPAPERAQALRAALVAFQKAQDLSPSGTADAPTFMALNRVQRVPEPRLNRE